MEIYKKYQTIKLKYPYERIIDGLLFPHDGPYDSSKFILHIIGNWSLKFNPRKIQRKNHTHLEMLDTIIRKGFK